MSKKVAIVNRVGFDGGGATTLCLQYAKLGFDVFIKNYVFPNQFLPELEPNIMLYDSIDSLVELVKNYDRLIFVNLWFGGYKSLPTSVFDDLLYLRNKYNDLDICYVSCCRNLQEMFTLLDGCKKYNFTFSQIFTLQPDLSRIVSDKQLVSYMNINAFTPSIKYEPVARDKRLKIVLTSGRIVGIKGINKFLSAVDDNFLQIADGFVFLHEGAGFTFNKLNSDISCPPQLLFLFDKTISPKIPKPQFAFKQYSESPELNKFNLYPSYNVDEIYNRWKYYYAGICCILGSKSAYYYRRTLLGNNWVVEDVRENNKIQKDAQLWNDTLEYADIEKILAGLPVFFSRKYSEIINFNDERLIYNSFSDIPQLVVRLSDYYDDARNEQYNWLMKKLDSVNNNIISKFTKEF